MTRDDKKGKRSKVIHINNAKVFKQREEFVGQVTVVMEEEDLG